jgi:hypothetical protein
MLIVNIGLQRLGAAVSIQTAQECISRQLYDVRHACDGVPECMPLDSGVLKRRLQLVNHPVFEKALSVVIPRKRSSVS